MKKIYGNYSLDWFLICPLTCLFLQEQKQQEKLAFERHLEEKHKEHAQLLLMNNSRKENILNSVRQVHHMLTNSWFCMLN